MTRGKQVVIVGGGLGGLRVARKLARTPLSITLVDRRNHHLFQPLLYQVVTGGLSADEVAVPIRSVLRGNDCRVLLGDAVGVDFDAREVLLRDGTPCRYDYLVLAAGAVPNYFAHPEWEKRALSLKSLDSALRLRERTLRAFEAAERTSDAMARRELLSFVVVGAGPTGVELAGGLSELGRFVMPPELTQVQRSDVRVTLVEQGPRVLPTFHPRASYEAERLLRELHVDVKLGTRVEDIQPRGALTARERIPARTVCWASGVRPSDLCDALAVERDERGAIVVSGDCSLPMRPEVFVIGDMASFRPASNQPPLAALASVAVQQADSVAKNIERDLARKPRQVFRYQDRGMLATVGRGRAIADIGPYQRGGEIEWWLWWAVHLYYLVGFRTRAMALLDWAFQYMAPRHRAGVRLITEREPLTEALQGELDELEDTAMLDTDVTRAGVHLLRERLRRPR